jgi:hypothetical protein|nr:MAG TPA: hypothetical protein [Caudoviricetes sp.]
MIKLQKPEANRFITGDSVWAVQYQQIDGKWIPLFAYEFTITGVACKFGGDKPQYSYCFRQENGTCVWILEDCLFSTFEAARDSVSYPIMTKEDFSIAYPGVKSEFYPRCLCDGEQNV